MNILLRMLDNPPFASYVIDRRPTLAELAQDLRAQTGLVHAFGADQYLAGVGIPAEIEVDPLSQRASFVFLSITEWSELIEGIPDEQPPGDHTGTWVAGRRVADVMALLPEDSSPDPELMLYTQERYGDWACLKPIRANLLYSAAEQYRAVEEVSKPCTECYNPEGRKRIANCDNKGCPRGCKIRR